MIPITISDHTQKLSKCVEKFIISNCGYNRLRPVRLSKVCKTFSTKKEREQNLVERQNNIVIAKSNLRSNEVKNVINNNTKQNDNINNKITSLRSLRRNTTKKEEQINRPILPAVLMTFDKRTSQKDSWF